MEMIQDYHYYTQLMRNGFYDKLFFVDKIFGEWKTLLDYGCAEGFTSKFIGKIFPDKQVIGYDPNPVMLYRAMYEGEVLDNVKFTDHISIVNDADIIYLSSTLHELYSYAKDGNEIDNFWQMVFCKKRKYVVIRDMMLSDNIYDRSPSESLVDAVINYAQQNQILHILEEFENIHSTKVTTATGITHWLLKYMYMTGPNYQRELRENYLSFSHTEMKSRIPPSWEISYASVAQIPYLTERWSKDMGINVPYPTHGKFILKKKQPW